MVEVPSQLKNLLKIKLLTLTFLEAALVLNENTDAMRAQFFFYCSYNMALKTSSVLIMNQDLLNWIEC